MYLATKTIAGKIHYFLRQSYKKNHSWHFREIFAFGTRPGEFIIYGGGNSFYLDEELLRKAGKFVDHDPENELEYLLWPFVDPEIRYKLAPFYKPERKFNTAKITAAEAAAMQNEIHDFDRRRLHYLRYGSITQGDLKKMRPKMLRVMLEKSRDEREQYFLSQEQVLEPEELKEYVYAIFDLKRYFSELIAHSMPEGLEQQRLDKYMINDLCRLNRDKSFWAGMAAFNGLHEYLQRYVIMFFDYDYRSSPFSREAFRRFGRHWSGNRAAGRDRPVSRQEAGAIFAVSPTKLQNMSRQELTRLYRQKAKEMHPDKGGNHDSFVKLTAAYNELLQTRQEGV